MLLYWLDWIFFEISKHINQDSVVLEDQQELKVLRLDLGLAIQGQQEIPSPGNVVRRTQRVTGECFS
jgi:hypothetical protein